MRKSHSCGISATFFQCCFMTETQVLMTVSDFSVIFFYESFPGRWLHFSVGGGFVFQIGGFIFKLGWHRFWWGRGVSKKIVGCPPTMGNPVQPDMNQKLSLKNAKYITDFIYQFWSRTKSSKSLAFAFTWEYLSSVRRYLLFHRFLFSMHN